MKKQSKKNEAHQKSRRRKKGAALGAAAATTKRSLERVANGKSAAKAVEKICHQRRNARPEHRWGWLLENDQAESFNDCAIRKNSPLRARLGRPRDPVADLEVVNAKGEVRGRVQCKVRKTPKHTAYAMALVKYREASLVTTEEMAPKGREAAKDMKARNGARDYTYVAENLDSTFEVDGIRSSPTPISKLDALAADPGRAKDRYVKPKLQQAVKDGAVAGGAGAGVTSLIGNTIAVAKGDKPLAAAAVDVAGDTAVGATKGALVAGGTLGVSEALSKAGYKGAAQSGLPGVIASAAVETGADACRLARGTIGWGEFGKRAAGNVFAAGLGWAGRALGTLLLPGAGTIAGGAVGGLVARWICG